MIVLYRDLLRLRIDTGDSDAHRVSDLLVTGELALAFVVADFHGWFAEHQAVVRASDFAAPDLAAGRWPSALRRDDMRLVTAGEGGKGPAAEARRAAKLERADCMVGPGCDEAARAAGELRSVRRLLGARLVASDREAGHVADLLLDLDEARVVALVVGTGLGHAAHQRVVPLAMVRSIDWELARVTLGCPAERVDASPELHEVTIDRSGWRSVLSYYGL